MSGTDLHPQPASQPEGLVAVYLPERVANALKAESKASRKSLDKLITQWLEDMEDGRAAARVARRIKEGKSKLIPAEEVYARLGLR
jgi:predicted DNA-binding protein